MNTKLAKFWLFLRSYNIVPRDKIHSDIKYLFEKKETHFLKKNKIAKGEPIPPHKIKISGTKYSYEVIIDEKEPNSPIFYSQKKPYNKHAGWRKLHVDKIPNWVYQELNKGGLIPHGTKFVHGKHYIYKGYFWVGTVQGETEWIVWRKKKEEKKQVK